VPAPKGIAFGRLNVASLLAQGIGVATVYYGDIDPDFEGLDTDQMPSAGQPIMHTLGYYMHAGGHGTIPSDWYQFVKFMQLHLRPGT